MFCLLSPLPMIGYFPEELQTGFDQNAAWHLKKQSQRPVTVKVFAASATDKISSTGLSCTCVQ